MHHKTLAHPENISSITHCWMVMWGWSGIAWQVVCGIYSNVVGWRHIKVCWALRGHKFCKWNFSRAHVLVTPPHSQTALSMWGRNKGRGPRFQTKHNILFPPGTRPLKHFCMKLDHFHSKDRILLIFCLYFAPLATHWVTGNTIIKRAPEWSCVTEWLIKRIILRWHRHLRLETLCGKGKEEAQQWNNEEPS